MDFGWTEEQMDRRAEVIEFAQRELHDDDLVARDREGLFSRDAWKRCARFGVLGLSVPKEYGGAEVDLSSRNSEGPRCSNGLLECSPWVRDARSGQASDTLHVLLHYTS